jgi:uracil-DNA glycosylase
VVIHRNGVEQAGGAARFLPEQENLTALREAAAGCRGCDLYRNATATVFGEGPAHARLMLVGEQPGDQEDKAGKPFVGPAGRLLDRAMDEAGIDRSSVYLTNAVKHFKWTPAERGKRRIHQKPARGEVLACLPWLTAELRVVRPGLVVCLGAVAAGAIFGPSFRLTQHRGELLDPPDTMPGDWRAVVTVHPSAVLRSPDREKSFQDFVADLRVVHHAMAA